MIVYAALQDAFFPKSNKNNNKMKVTKKHGNVRKASQKYLQWENAWLNIWVDLKNRAKSKNEAKSNQNNEGKRREEITRKIELRRDIEN